MVVMVLDRKWPEATLWAVFGAVLAVFGVIHMPQAGFKTFSEPLWEQCYGLDDNGEPECWEDAQQWMFAVAYLILAVTFGFIMVLSKFDDTIKSPVDDESAHAFDDWFKDATKGAIDNSSSDEELAKDKDETAGEPRKELSSSEDADEAGA